MLSTIYTEINNFHICFYILPYCLYAFIYILIFPYMLFKHFHTACVFSHILFFNFCVISYLLMSFAPDFAVYQTNVCLICFIV